MSIAELIKLIEKERIGKGIAKTKMAKMMGMSVASYYRKIKSEEFLMSEVITACNCFGWRIVLAFDNIEVLK